MKKIVLFFIILTILITFPSVIHLGDRMIGDPGDGYQFIGFQYLGYKQIASGMFPFGHTDYWRYPYGVNFQDLSDSSLFVLIGIPFYFAFNNPIFVYNLSVLFLLVLNLFLSYLSFGVFFPPLVTLVGTIMYGISFYTISKTGGHVNLLLHASLLFFISSVVKVYQEKGSKRSFVWLTTAAILIPFSSLQHPFFLLASSPFIVTLALFFYKKESIKSFKLLIQKKNQIALMIITTISLVFLFHGHKIINFLNGNVNLLSPNILTVPLINFFIPNSYLTSVAAIVTNGTYRWIEMATFVGYVELFLFIAACFYVQRSPTKLFLIAATVIFFILSIGTQKFLPFIWPYQYLAHIFPYRAILESGRFFIIFYIWFTFLILLFLSQIQGKKIIIAILFLLIVERLPLSFQSSSNLYEEKFVNSVRKSETSAVLDLPLYTESFYGPWYDMYSIYYQKPIVNGYFHWSADTGASRKLTDSLAEYKCFRSAKNVPRDYSHERAVAKKEEVLREMKKYNIRTLVIHKDLNLDKTTCSRAKQYIDVLLADMSIWEKVYESKEKLVLFLQ